MGLFSYIFWIITTSNGKLSNMRYVIVLPLALFAALLWLGVGYCGYLGFTQAWTWFMVGFGLSYTAVVATGVVISGFDAVKDW